MVVELGAYQLGFATEFGPRITSLRLGDGREQFARLGPESVLEHDGGRYEFRGGHRLWAAPEIPRITYAADDRPCEISESRGALSVIAPPDSAGLVKEVRVSEDGDGIVVDHRLTQRNGEPVGVAAWAITQFPMGGTAILPFEAPDTGPVANRNLVLWPYTSIEDRRLTLGDEAIEIEAVGERQLKLGVGPTPRKLGYYQDGSVFIKEIESAEKRNVPDFGAAGQVYVGQGFCELESVGGLSELANGGEARIRERWTVLECADLDAAVALTLA